jgi:hypothetical protein
LCSNFISMFLKSRWKLEWRSRVMPVSSYNY